MRRKAIETTKTWNNKDLENGATLEGKFIKREIFNGEFGETTKYVIETKDGEMMGVYSTASLTRQFNNIPEGAYVWITYKGEETSKNGRNVYKVFEVEYDDEV